MKFTHSFGESTHTFKNCIYISISITKDQTNSYKIYAALLLAKIAAIYVCKIFGQKSGRVNLLTNFKFVRKGVNSNDISRTPGAPYKDILINLIILKSIKSI